jgi:hypothetical protein
MSAFARPLAAAFGIACMMLLTNSLSIGGAFAKDDPPPQAGEEQIKQIALTDKQVEGVIAAKPQIDPILAKLGDKEPDPKTIAALDGVAKKNGFVDYNDYDLVVNNVSLVLDGFDPEAKKYVGTEAVLKAQIAQVQADKKMPAKDKKEALGELNEGLKAAKPLQHPENVKVVTKYYDKLSALIQQDQPQQ